MYACMLHLIEYNFQPHFRITRVGRLIEYREVDKMCSKPVGCGPVNLVV